MGGSECPACGAGFDTEHGMKTHHVQAHGESLSTVSLTCAKCGEEFERGEYDVVEAENYYCSYECRRNEGEHSCPKDNCDYTSDSELGIKQHHKRTHGESLTVVEVECEWCGDNITRQRSLVEQYDNTFCDKNCRTSWVSDRNSGEDHYDYSQKKVECENCGKMFTTTKHERERTKRNFCSQSCYGESLTGNMSGEDNPRWRGGYDGYYGPNWPEQRRKALQRDEHQCQDCGMTQKEHQSKWGRDIEMHHKTPFRTFEDSAEANQLDNLITLCKDCHANR